MRLTKKSMYVINDAYILLYSFENFGLSSLNRDKQKFKLPVYYRTDTHWNWMGGYIAYKTILECLSKSHSDLNPLPLNKFEKHFTTREGDMAVMIGSGEKMKEHDILHMSPDVIDIEIPEWISKNIKNVRGQQLKGQWDIIFEGNRSKKLRAVVFRDSFFLHIRPYFSHHFREILYINSYFDMKTVVFLLKNFIPDIILEERLERGIKFIPWNKGTKEINSTILDNDFKKIPKGTLALFVDFAMNLYLKNISINHVGEEVALKIRWESIEPVYDTYYCSLHFVDGQGSTVWKRDAPLEKTSSNSGYDITIDKIGKNILKNASGIAIAVYSIEKGMPKLLEIMNSVESDWNNKRFIISLDEFCL